MVREARTVGAPFDEDALESAGYLFPDASHMYDATDPANSAPLNIPHIAVADSSYPEGTAPGTPEHCNWKEQHASDDDTGLLEHLRKRREHVHHHLHTASTAGVIHDALSFNAGTPHSGVLSWRFMEYMPFRRMDLKEDGTWAPIRFPLPMGEVRDIPRDAVVHNSALRRMRAHDRRGNGDVAEKQTKQDGAAAQDGKKANTALRSYRPGNLIVGGGGRGVRFAPEHYGIGEWKILREEGDPVGECWVRGDADVVCERDHTGREKGKTTVEGAAEAGGGHERALGNEKNRESDTSDHAERGGAGRVGGIKFAGNYNGAEHSRSEKWKGSAKDRARKLSLWM